MRSSPFKSNKVMMIMAFRIIFIGLLGLLLVNCSTGVEPSKKPGLLRVILQPDQSDTTIVIADETFVMSEKDEYTILISQGRIFRPDSSYFQLFPNTNTYTSLDLTFNLNQRDSITNLYAPVQVFATYLPVDEYNQLQFAMYGQRVTVGGIEIPLQLPQGASPTLDLPINLQIKEGEITEIILKMGLFQSVTRYQDIFLFTPKIDVVSINYLGRY